MTELARELTAGRPSDSRPRVLLLDNVGRLLPEDYRRLVTATAEDAAKTKDLCLWCGNLDARYTDRQFGVKLCSVPSAHVSFPILTRDELLAGYRAIASDRGLSMGGCRAVPDA